MRSFATARLRHLSSPQRSMATAGARRMGAKSLACRASAAHSMFRRSAPRWVTGDCLSYSSRAAGSGRAVRVIELTGGRPKANAAVLAGVADGTETVVDGLALANLGEVVAAFVLPSLHEGYGMVFAEAMAH